MYLRALFDQVADERDRRGVTHIVGAGFECQSEQGNSLAVQTLSACHPDLFDDPLFASFVQAAVVQSRLV